MAPLSDTVLLLTVILSGSDLFLFRFNTSLIIEHDFVKLFLFNVNSKS